MARRLRGPLDRSIVCCDSMQRWNLCTDCDAAVASAVAKVEPPDTVFSLVPEDVGAGGWCHFPPLASAHCLHGHRWESALKGTGWESQVRPEAVPLIKAWIFTAFRPCDWMIPVAPDTLPVISEVPIRPPGPEHLCDGPCIVSVQRFATDRFYLPPGSPVTHVTDTMARVLMNMPGMADQSTLERLSLMGMTYRAFARTFAELSDEAPEKGPRMFRSDAAERYTRAYPLPVGARALERYATAEELDVAALPDPLLPGNEWVGLTISGGVGDGRFTVLGIVEPSDQRSDEGLRAWPYGEPHVVRAGRTAREDHIDAILRWYRTFLLGSRAGAPGRKRNSAPLLRDAQRRWDEAINEACLHTGKQAADLSASDIATSLNLLGIDVAERTVRYWIRTERLPRPERRPKFAD